MAGSVAYFFRPPESGFDLESNPLDVRDDGPAPSLDGTTGWLHSPPVQLNQLSGRVVLLKFWTMACGSCRRSLPYVNAWYEKYRQDGLTVIGIHTPETAPEGDPGRIAAVCKELGILFPVALDADYTIWNRYHLFGWPTLILIDKRGRVVARKIGEGNYPAVERHIRELLSQPA